MARTYTKFRNDCGQITNNTETGNLALLDIFINDSIRAIYNLQGGRLRFLESVKEQYTVANQAEYEIPNGFRKLISLLVWSAPTTAGVPYTPEMIFDPAYWNRVQQMKLGSGTVPYFTYVQDQKLLIYPVPSASGNLIQLRGRTNIKDLSIADITTAKVVSIANGATAMTISTTAATADWVGRYIQITETEAANGGDGMWYEIGSYTNSTTIGLVKPYEGTSIVAGTAACTVGQVSMIPEAYDVAPVYRACALYFNQQNDIVNSKAFWMLYDGGMEAGYRDTYGGIIQQMLDNEGETEEGSYIPPQGSLSTSKTGVPYYFPMTDASGF